MPRNVSCILLRTACLAHSSALNVRMQRWTPSDIHHTTTQKPIIFINASMNTYGNLETLHIRKNLALRPISSQFKFIEKSNV